MRREIAVGAALAGLMLLMLGNQGLGCYSGLLVIPTAATVGENHYSREYQTDGVVQGLTTDAALLNNEIGLGRRCELGADIDLRNSDSRLIGNAKCVAYASSTGTLAAAIGMAGVANHLRPTPYVVASLGAGSAHVHIGSMHIEGSNRCIAGFDRQFGRLTLMGDYTSGDGAVSSLGFDYQFSDHFGIMAGALFPRGNDDARFTVHFVFCQPLRKAGR